MMVHNCSSLQITITAALGFDSYVVMRHGAGPLSYVSDTKSEGEDALSAQIGNLHMEGADERTRLGCYFCNDVVAPIDVIFLITKTSHIQFSL